MTLTLRSAGRLAALVAFLAAITTSDAARANHFILCDDYKEKCFISGWNLTGSLEMPRQNHSAILLSDGKVLVAGGSDDNGGVLASAELYDPTTETWSVTGSMSSPRAGHVALLLPTRKVLVVGGDQPCCISAITVELYDPDTGRWSSAGGLGPRIGMYAVMMLRSGQVFVTGASPEYRSVAWIYDPVQSMWTQTMGDPVYRQDAEAVLLHDGTVLVKGGTIDADGVVTAFGTELYEPATGGWRMADNAKVLRNAGTSTVLADGSVLAAGGFSWVTQGYRYAGITYPMPLRSSESYDANGMWRPAGDLNDGRYSHTASLMPDGRVLVAGGESSRYEEDAYSETPLKSAELYDPSDTTWVYTSSSLNIARARHTATSLGDGSVLVVGGVGRDSSNASVVLRSAERYFPGPLNFTDSP